MIRSPWFPWLALVVVTLIAYGNAMHSEVVWDDRVFLSDAGFQNVSVRDFPGFFSQSLWEAAGNTTKLYRPMLMLTFGMQSLVFGDWWTGFHAVNVLMHVLVTLLVYGFARHFLAATGLVEDRSSPAILLAAMVFGVHPVFTDAVNSLFNGSEIFATAGVVGGLLYLLRNRERPVYRTWTVLSVVFLLALMYRESAVTLLPLAFITLWFTSARPWKGRIRECLPVFILLVPLAVYFALRINAFELPDIPPAQSENAPAAVEQPLAGESPGTGEESLTADGLETGEERLAVDQADAKPATEAKSREKDKWKRLGLVLNPKKIARAVPMWFDAFSLMVWPSPLLILRLPSTTSFWLALAVQFALFACALFAAYKKRPEFLFGLFFFYLAILPSSRVISESMTPPMLMDRMLYLPSIGLVIILAAVLIELTRRMSLRTSVIIGSLLIVVLTPVTWARNQEWSSDMSLLTADYAKRPDSDTILVSMLRAYARKGDLSGAIGICESDPKRIEKEFHLSWECAKTMMTYGKMERAETLFLRSVRRRPHFSWAHFDLGILYARTGRRDLARERIQMAMDREKLPFMREIMQAITLLELYPGDRYRMNQAAAHLERALELQPRAIQAQSILDELEKRR